MESTLRYYASGYGWSRYAISMLIAGHGIRKTLGRVGAETVETQLTPSLPSSTVVTRKDSKGLLERCCEVAERAVPHS